MMMDFQRKQVIVKLRNVVLSCALVFSATACGGSDDDFAEDMVSLLEGVSQAVSSAGDDCGKMASNLESFVTKNESKLKKLKAKSEELKKDEAAVKKMKESMKKYEARAKKAMPGMMGMMKCAEDPKVKELEQKFKGLL
jgi:cell shape-determining protein MreC